MLSHRHSLGKAVRLPLRAIPRDAVLPVLSGPNCGLRWIAGSFAHGCWIGWYEPRVAKLLARVTERGMVAFDIGANVGYFTLLLARAVGPRGKVFAFEPAQRNASLLRRHLALNGFRNVEVVQAAVSDRAGTASFAAGHGPAGGHISEAGETVETVIIDDFPRPAIIKMDIEGGEIAALAGAGELLRARATRWVVELHGDERRRMAYDIFRDYHIEPVTNLVISAAPAA